METSNPNHVLTHATKEDIEAVAEAIELVEGHASELYAIAAIAELESRGWKPSIYGEQREPRSA